MIMSNDVLEKSGIIIQNKDDFYDMKSNKSVFTEEVYKSVIIKEELNKVLEFDLYKELQMDCSKIVSFNDVKSTCSNSGLRADISIKSINGVLPPFPKRPYDYNGFEYTDLSFLSNLRREEIKKYAPLIIDEEILIKGELKITIYATAILVNGEEKKFSASKIINIGNGKKNIDVSPDIKNYPIKIRKFPRLEFPTSTALSKPYLVQRCAVNANFILPFGADSLNINREEKKGITVNGLLALYIKGDIKVSVPVEICVLTTGFCMEN